MNEETIREKERIKNIIKEVFDGETHLKLMRNISRLEHMQKRILFRIDNPDYVRKV